MLIKKPHDSNMGVGRFWKKLLTYINDFFILVVIFNLILFS